MSRRTYIDSCVLIAAYKGSEPAHKKALAIIRDESRSFVVSDLLTLECVSAAIRSKEEDQAEFCRKFIESSENEKAAARVSRWALDVFSKHSIQPVDLLHMAVAVAARAEEFITTEKPTKPFFTIGAPLEVVSIHE